MARISRLDKRRQIVHWVSSSIANFRTKITERYKLPLWHWWRNRNDICVFFGLYHRKDFYRFICHRGERRVLWCGGDIINLKTGYSGKLWKYIIPLFKATHYCENGVEQTVLDGMGISARILPQFFDDPKNYDVATPTANIQVYLTAHPYRETEYGLQWIAALAQRFPDITFHIYGVMGESFEDNVVWHGAVGAEDFDRQIKNFHAALRLNEFDGFAETLAKSALMGQQPISTIYYPYIKNARPIRGLINALEDLKKLQYPNLEAREYYLKLFQDNYETLIETR